MVVGGRVEGRTGISGTGQTERTHSHQRGQWRLKPRNMEEAGYRLKIFRKEREVLFGKRNKGREEEYYLERLSGGEVGHEGQLARGGPSVNGANIYFQGLVMGFKQDGIGKALSREPSRMQSLLY